MSSIGTEDPGGRHPIWDALAPTAATFPSLSTKPRSPFSRRQVVLIFTTLLTITLCVLFWTSKMMPTTHSGKPWQLKTSRPCERSILGKDLVADEFGYTCPWQDSWMQPSGCCDQTASSTARFSCETCDAGRGCCGVYELCVSCCLKEENLKAQFQSDRMKQLAAKDKEMYESLQDPFELCQTVCRTSSQSLDNVAGSTVFRSEALKYCYSTPTFPTPTLRIPSNPHTSSKATLASDSSSTSTTESDINDHSFTLQSTEEHSSKRQRVARQALAVGKGIMRHTSNILTAAASTNSPIFVLVSYLLLLCASLAFLRM